MTIQDEIDKWNKSSPYGYWVHQEEIDDLKSRLAEFVRQTRDLYTGVGDGKGDGIVLAFSRSLIGDSGTNESKPEDRGEGK